MNPEITLDTYRDYNDPSWCPMLTDQQDAINDLSEVFDWFVDEVSLVESGEWEHNYPCSGIRLSCGGAAEDWEPVEIDVSGSPGCAGCLDDGLVEAYDKYYPRLRMLYEWLDRKRQHLDKCPLTGWWGDYVRRKDRALERKVDCAISYYERLIEEMCEELASLYMKCMEEECDYYETDDAAREWVEANDGVPISHYMINDASRSLGLGWFVDNDEFERICELLANYMGATGKYRLNESEIRLATKLIAA